MTNVLNRFENPNSSNDNAFILNGKFQSNKVSQSKLITVTLDDINSGVSLVEGVAGKTIQVLDFKAKVVGNFMSSTSIDIQDTNVSPVTSVSMAVAALNDGVILNETSTNVTMGSGYLGSSTVGEGLQLVSIGSPATGGTSITLKIDYIIS